MYVLRLGYPRPRGRRSPAAEAFISVHIPQNPCSRKPSTLKPQTCPKSQVWLSISPANITSTRRVQVCFATKELLAPRIHEDVLGLFAGVWGNLGISIQKGRRERGFAGECKGMYCTVWSCNMQEVEVPVIVVLGGT